nr:MAG TPA: hypothetical protein [Caudoviricetes sp.]
MVCLFSGGRRWLAPGLCVCSWMGTLLLCLLTR